MEVSGWRITKKKHEEYGVVLANFTQQDSVESKPEWSDTTTWDSKG